MCKHEPYPFALTGDFVLPKVIFHDRPTNFYLTDFPSFVRRDFCIIAVLTLPMLSTSREVQKCSLQ
jgi:hypothetical protein